MFRVESDRYRYSNIVLLCLFILSSCNVAQLSDPAHRVERKLQRIKRIQERNPDLSDTITNLNTSRLSVIQPVTSRKYKTLYQLPKNDKSTTEAGKISDNNTLPHTTAHPENYLYQHNDTVRLAFESDTLTITYEIRLFTYLDSTANPMQYVEEWQTYFTPHQNRVTFKQHEVNLKPRPKIKTPDFGWLGKIKNIGNYLWCVICTSVFWMIVIFLRKIF